jgi:hypothetical protein
MEAVFVDLSGSTGRHARPRLALRWRWTLACGAGEMIGLVYPALAGVLLAAFFGGVEPSGLPGKLLVLAVMVLAGAAEGATLGLFQARILADLLPGFRVRRWVKATAIIAMIGWIGGMAMPLFGPGAPGGDPQAAEPPLGAMLLYAAAFGGVAGLVFGGGQWLVLRRYATGGLRWILCWGLAWALAMMLIFAIAGLQTETTKAWAVILGAAIAGGGAGLVIGLVSSIGVGGLKPRPRVEGAAS